MTQLLRARIALLHTLATRLDPLHDSRMRARGFLTTVVVWHTACGRSIRGGPEIAHAHALESDTYCTESVSVFGCLGARDRFALRRSRALFLAGTA